MARPVRTYAFVVVFVTLAGCSAFAGGPPQEPTDTLTPAPVTDTATPVPEAPPDGPELAGVSRNGTVVVDRFAASHRAEARSSTYTWVYAQRQTAPETDEQLLQYTRRVELDGNATLVETSGLPYIANSTRYLTGDCGYQRQVLDIESPYSTFDPVSSGHTYAPAGELLETYLVDGQYRLDTATREGEQYVRLHLRTEDPPPRVVDELSDIRRYRATAYVTPDGFVRTLAVAFRSTTDAGIDRRVSIRFDYRAVNETTVSQPDWVAKIWGDPAGQSETPDGDRPEANTTDSDC